MRHFLKAACIFLLLPATAIALPLIHGAGGKIPVELCSQFNFPHTLFMNANAPQFFTSKLDPILGHWTYDGYFYEGHRFPNPNPDLDLEFEFRADGTSRLFWERKEERGYCERLADASIENNQLRQRTTWVNPANASSCGSDPDMQKNRDTTVAFEIKGDELWLNIGLSGKDFFYILKFRSL